MILLLNGVINTTFTDYWVVNTRWILKEIEINKSQKDMEARMAYFTNDFQDGME